MFKYAILFMFISGCVTEEFEKNDCVELSMGEAGVCRGIVEEPGYSTSAISIEACSNAFFLVEVKINVKNSDIKKIDCKLE